MIPFLVAKGLAVKLCPDDAPAWHVKVHQRDKAVAVRTLDEMRDLVTHEIVDTGQGLFRQFEIEPNAVRRGVACAPFRAHPLDTELGDGDVVYPCPMIH